MFETSGNAFKKWLEQKRQQYIDLLKMEDCLAEITPYDELLEELNEEAKQA